MNNLACALPSLTAAVALLVPAVLVARDETARVVVLAPQGLESVSLRLRAELESYGFDVEPRLTESLSTSRETVEALAQAERAVAVLVLPPTPRGVEVWLMDRVSHRVVLREAVRGEGESDAVLALRAVEVLRASLLEIDVPISPRETPPPDAGSPPESPAVAPPPVQMDGTSSLFPDILSLYVGGTLTTSAGGLTLAGHVDLRMRLRPVDVVSVAARLWIPTAPITVEAAEGRSEQTLLFAGVDGMWHPLSRPSVIELEAGVLAGVVWMRSSGAAAFGYLGRTDDVVVGAVGVDVAGTVRLARWLSLYFSSAVLVALPRPTVDFAGRLVAAWGRPAVLLSLGLQVTLW